MFKKENFKNIKNIYFIGIKGVGMTMLASFLSKLGYNISGSDTEETFMTDKVLKKANIVVKEGFDAKNIKEDIDLIVYSSAYNEDNNSELKKAKEQNKIKVINYAQALSFVFNQFKGVAVVGSHGKTTVSAWLSYVLYQAGKDPKALIGASVGQLKGSSLLGSSNYLIAEVDEYQNKLQYFNPFATILLNIDYDHPDFFKTKSSYTKVFSEFVKKIDTKGFLLYNLDDDKCKAVAENTKAKKISVSIKNKEANYLAFNICQKNNKQIFDVQVFKAKKSYTVKDFKISLLGEHSIYNALTVIASSRNLGLSYKEIKEGLSKFKGASRRMEFLGKFKNLNIFDDYGHHPTEIKSTVSGLRQKYKDRHICVVFHPHTYTRTKALFKEFSASFMEADEVLVTDIYGSAREVQGGVSSQDLVKEVKKYNKINHIEQQVSASGDLKATEKYLRNNYQDKDIVLLLGAGDVFRVGEALLS